MRAVTTFVLCFSLFVIAAGAQQPAKPFEPVSGQAGKDVVWVPSPPDMVDKLMTMAKVTPSDFVMDLGSGDGRNVIAAAKLGARALGVEFNPDMVALSRRLAQEAGVADKAQFVEADMYGYDISKATVMALFLLPVNMNRLAPKFFDLAPGSRIVGNTFGIDGWQPDARETLPQTSECESWCEALLWIVPAKVAGTWTMGSGSMTLTQEYQMLQGSVTSGGATHPIAKGRLRGEELTFTAGERTYTGKAGGRHHRRHDHHANRRPPLARFAQVTMVQLASGAAGAAAGAWCSWCQAPLAPPLPPRRPRETDGAVGAVGN